MAATSPEFNLKHRLTGAAILLLVAVLLVVLLISQPDRRNGRGSDLSGETFVSRIASPGPVTRPQADNAVGAVLTPGQEAIQRMKARKDERSRSNASTDVLKPISKTDRREPLESENSSGEGLKPVLERSTDLERPEQASTAALATLEQKPAAEVEVAEVPVKASPATGKWVVRVGAFKRKSNVNRVVTRLDSKGYKAAQAPVKSADGGDIIRVWVGPFPSRRDALRAKNDISRDVGLNGFVSKLQ